MSTPAEINAVFGFNRNLPTPFDTLKSKTVKVCSKHGTGDSTLTASVIKAVHAVCHCMARDGEGAIGRLDNKNVAEYKSSKDPNEYHLAVYDNSNGNILVSVFDKSSDIVENYVCTKNDRDGAAIMMALFPTFTKDPEFQENFDAYYEALTTGYPDMTAATNAMAIMCDNVYRRLTNNALPEHIKLEMTKDGKVTRLSSAQIDSRKFTPKEVVAGEFTILAKTGPAPKIGRAATVVAVSDFEGKYALNAGRTFSLLEQSLIPKLEDWYIIPEQVVGICHHAQATTGKPTQMRNFYLRGPAGTGKTAAARAIAAGLGLPYMKYTCSANSEIFDFIGQLIPDVDGGSTGNADLDKEREELKAMGGITFENVKKLMQLPDLDDMDYDPVGTYKRLTGTDNEDATSQGCMAVVLSMVTDKVVQLSKKEEKKDEKGQSFRYEESDFIRALKNGYLVEVQEPSTIAQPGVLVGLNSLLEQKGSITLPTGEIIQRHPDSVVVITTNVSYEGCRAVNQSVVDRMSLVMDIELPEPEVMVQRAMSITGETDELMVSDMVHVVNDMAETCRKNNITDGSVGMRSLIDWIVSTQITGDPYQSALMTVISKATTEKEDRDMLIDTVLDPFFNKKKPKKAV